MNNCKKQTHSRKISKQLISFLVLFVCNISIAYADTLILKSGPHSNYQKAAATISQQLEGPSQIMELSEYAANKTRYSGFNNYVAIGSEAAHEFIEHLPTHKKLYISYIPRITYLKLLENYKNSQRVKGKLLSAVFIDQPYERQFNLTSLIKPEASNIAIALGPNTKEDQTVISNIALKRGVNIKIDDIHPDDNPVFKLQKLISNTDIFLSIPDSSLYNRTTAKWLLYISFKKRIPLIGFSKKYVEAGAIAAVISTPEQIGLQTSEMVNSHKGKHFPEPQYPKYFSVVTNPAAAKSLRIALPAGKELTQRLEELEK